MTSVRLTLQPIWQPFRAAAELVSDVIGPALHGRATDAAAATNVNWIVLLTLNASIALFLVAVGQGAGRRGSADASLFFWSGVILLLLPPASRIAWPVLARGERLFLLLLLTESLFLYKLFYSPTSFPPFDEMLHWMTAHDILYRHKLFLSNNLLPISPDYPGIEILTTALANLAGLTIFPASVLVIATLRATFISALFLFFETILRSSRLAAIACLVYMGSATFVWFDAMFSYETLGVVLWVLTMMVEAKAANRQPRLSARALVLIGMLLASLAMTHHMTAFVCALYFVGLATLEALRRDPVPVHARIRVVAVIAVLAVMLPLLWNYAMGDPAWDYLGPVIERGVRGMANILFGGSSERKIFVAEDGKQQPIGYQIIGIGSTLLLALGLSTGFFRSLALTSAGPARSGWPRILRIIQRKWRDSRIVLLTFGAFGFPVSVAFRLSGSGAGWQIGNRMAGSVFVAVGLVVAVSIVHFWQMRLSQGRLAVTSLAIGTILLSGITIGQGTQALRGLYKPGDDAGSVEPMGVAAAAWTKRWLGEGNRFAADRVNQLLLATYGQQDIISEMRSRIQGGRIFLARSVSPDVLYWIRKGRIDYLLADLRITTAPAVLGKYFGDDDPGHGPPPPSMLLKFDKDDRVGRIFDNGWIVIFDVRALHDDE
jgi:hypothetical protein